MQLRKSDFNVFSGDYSEFIKYGFRPRAGINPVRLKLPIEWDMDPLNDRNWQFQLHGWRMLQPIWKQFYGLDPERAVREVLPWVRDWHDFHVRRRRKSTFMWYDMSTGLRAQHLALLLHLHQSGVSLIDPESLAEVEELASMHIAKLRDPAFISKGNHGIFQLAGLRLLGIVWATRSETQGEEEYSCRLMGDLLESQFGPQGVHVENSPDYHLLALAQFSRIRPELFPGIADLYHRKLAAAREVSPWFTLPSGAHAAIGDSEKDGECLVEPFHQDGESLTPSGERMVMRDFSEGGYVIVRSGPEVRQRYSSMLIVKGQAFSRSHAHADQLGFELFSFGRSLFVDSGKFGYNRDAWREYFVSDRAHNVVGLQGVTFGPDDTQLGTGGLSRPETEKNGTYIIKGAVRRGDLFTHDRRLIYTPGRSLVIEDEILAGESDAPIVYFHLAAGLEAKPRNGGVEIWSAGVQLATLLIYTPGFTVQTVYGQNTPYIQGWLSPAYGSRVPATAIELRGKPGMRRWLTEITLIDAPAHSCGPSLPSIFPAGIVLGFPHTIAAEREVLLADGRMQKRFVAEYKEGTAEMIDRSLEEDLPHFGFHRLSSRPEQGGLRAYYHHEELALSVLIRPAAYKPVRTPGARGSVYFAFSYPQR